MLILTALTTRVCVAAADGLRCAGASDGRVTVTGSYPSGQSNLDVTTCRPSATLRCAALVLLFPMKVEGHTNCRVAKWAEGHRQEYDKKLELRLSKDINKFNFKHYDCNNFIILSHA